MKRLFELSRRIISREPHPRASLSLQLALLLTLPLLLVGLGRSNGSVGSLPSADGGDGSQNFYLQAPRDLVEDLIVDAWGSGYFVVVPLPDEEVWLEFYGDVSVQLDRAVIAAHLSEIDFGLSAGFNGGGMVVVPEVDGQLSSRRISIGAGFTLDTPYRRIDPLLDAPLTFHTTQRLNGQRAEIEYIGMGGLFVIQQDLK